MENKNSMSRVERLHREKVTRYSIRKYSFGAASVAVAALFMFLGNGAVSADMTAVQPQDESGLKAKPTDENAELPQVEKEVAQPAESTPAAQPIAEEPTAKPAEPATPALDKKQLENYIAEIEAKLSNGSYANKTDESVAVLKADLEAAKTTLANATSQDELTKAYNKLVTTANTKLKNKPVEKKETSAVDTTNGKETVGKKAENTEKKSDSNAIENTGSNDARNGQALDKNNAFRAETTEKSGNFTYSMEYSTGKEIYLYNEEEANVNITVNSTAGNITKATVKAGSGQFLLKSKSDQAIAYTKFRRGSMPPEEEVERDDYGWSYRQTLTETPGPVTINITGKPNDKFKELKSYTKTEDQHAVLGARYLQLEDSNGNRLSGGSNLNAPGAFNLVVKSQTYKYDIKDLTEERRITVNDINNITTTDLTTIKSRLKLEYSKKSNDARFESLKGTEVTNPTSLIDTVAVSTTDSSKLVVTYVDGSTDEIEKSKVLNVKPAGIIPFSNPTTKEIYVYKGEETNLEFGVTDDSGKVKDLRIVQGSANINNSGAARGQVKNEYGLTMTSETNGNGIVATTANPATTRITGTISVPGKPNYVGPLMTRYLVAEDLDGAIFSNPDANKNLDQEGAFKLVVREQTQKFDIQGQTEENNKIAVSDVNNLSDADFENIKNNIKIQYKTSDDERLKDKDGTLVENASQYIQSITKEGDKIVVTYKDGSTDKLELSSVVRTNPAPTVELPYSNADKRQIYVYSGENTDLTFKASDDAALKKVYLRGPGNKDFDNATSFGFTTGKINDGALESGEGTVSSDKQNATIKMTGVTSLKAGAKWTSIIVAQDEDDARSIDNFNSTEDFAERQQRPGYVEFIVKDQTSKYDIKAPTEKVAVTDPANVTKDELAKIKEKLQLEYKKDNDDANVAKDADVTDKDAKIDSVTKDDQGNLVVTYKDGSKDTRPLSEFVTLDKQPAIDEVNKAAEKQIEAINKTPNATDEEKQAAIDKVNADKKKALDEIAKPEVTTKDALDKAQKSGTDAIAKDNPVVAKKDEAKADVEAARKAKEDAIKANPNLSDEEKDAAIAKVNKVAEDAKKAIDAATSNADVETAKGTGTTAIDNVTPVAKTAAKKAIADALTAKTAELDKRTDLTDEEKTAAKAEAQKLADAQLAEIAKQPDAADTKEAAKTAQDAVNAAGTKGAADVAAVNPEAKSKPAAKKAIDDKLAEQLKTIENTPDATTDEKKVAADAAKALADEAKEEIDKAGTDAEVKQLQDEAKKEIEKSVPVVEDKPNARKAIDDEATAKKAAIDARDDLTPKAKEDLKAQVDKIAEQAKKSVDAAKTAEAVNGIEESDKAAIKAVGEVNIPADKVLVNDPSDLTDAEKAKVLEAVKKVNPDAKEITQDADGNITVTTPDGHQEIITPEQVVKTADTANDPKAGNDVVKPADKVVVNDPAKLTDAEKEKIKAAVEAVNPNSIVVVDDKGNAKVSTPDGQTQVIPVEDLVRTVEDTKKPNAGDDIVKPADKTVVANPDALTPEEKKAIEDKVKAVNPGSTVVVDDKGNATVTTPEGKTAVIPATDLTKSAADAAKPNAGNDIVKPADKTVVANPDKLTDAEKKAIEDKVKAVNPDATVVVDDKGNATVTTPEGKTAVIPASDLTKDPEAATKPNAGNDIVKPADKTVVANPDKLTDAEKKAIEDKVKAVNPGSTVVVDDKGNATVTTPEGKTAVIPASDLTKSAADVAKPNAGDDIVKPADKTVVANPDKLTDAEKKTIEDKVKAVNPGSTVVVDDKGNATVTTPEGKTAVIPASDLTKSEADAAKPNAGNDIVKPADKTVVANPDKLTDAEKKAIEDKVKAVNPDATVVVDDKGNATVTTPEGKTAVIPASDLTKSAADAAKPNAGNDIVKPADKTVVANPDKLTDAEKKAIEDKVKAVNPGSTVVVDDKGNATVTTPAGKTAVIPATDLVKSPEDATKPNAGNDIVKPADKTAVTNPDALTPEEKKAIEDKVKAVNPGSTVVVDDKGNATVTTPEGKTAVIPATDLVKSPEDATKPNAGNDIVKPADKTVVANPDKLTDAEKKAIEDKVKAVNPGSTVVVDDKGNATVTTPAGKTAVIPATDLTKSEADVAKPNAGDDIVKPADKTVVANPDKLTDAEKKAIEDKVKAVNPGSTVVVDDKGNATVTTPAGKTAVIPASDLTKSAADAAKPNAGNDIVKPADKTVVANPDALTPEEKKAIEDKVKAVNPGSTVVVDDKGNATVTTPAGKTAVIPASDLTKSAADAAKPNAGNDIVKPADKTVVANPDKLTDAEKKAIEDKVKAVNPGSTVVVDDKGNATVTTPEGKTAVIPASDLTKSAADAAKPNAGDDIVKPADKTVVANPDKLTDAEKKAIEDKVKAVNPGSIVVVDDKGNATVTTPEGETAVIPASDLTKSAADAAKPNAGDDIVKPADKTVVANPDKLTDAEKKAIEDKVKAVNPGSTVVVDDKGNATVTTPEGKTAVIPATDLVKSPEDATKPNAGNDIVKPADKTVVANPDKLTDAEKKAIEDKVKAVNPGSTVVVDDKGNATVTTPEGKTAVIPASDLTKSAADAAKPNAGDDIVKPADKTVVANPDKLTDAEKKAIEDKVKAVNPGSIVVVDDKGNATVTTPEGKTAVIPASDLTKSEADATKPNAGNDIVKPADKTVVANPDALTPEEKKAIEDKVKAVNPDSTVVVDDKGNATVTTPAGKTAVIPATDLTKSAADAAKPNAGNDIVKPAAKTVVANPDALTSEEKKAIEDKVKAVNPGSTVVVDDKGNATVTTPAGKTAVIPASDLTKSEADAAKPNAGNDVNTPAAKTVVANPDKLTDAEKKAIEDKVKAVNPGSTVVVDDKGNATVTTPEGKTAVIPATDLVKTQDDITKENAGNDVNTPAAKTVVANPDALTSEEKKAIEDKVKAVNPGSTVVVDDKGNATVAKGDGTVLNIPALDLVIPADDLADAAKNTAVKTPAIRTLVADKEKLTDAEKAAVKKAIEAVNPGATVVVDDKGNATVTLDGNTVSIAKDQLVKTASDVTAKNSGDNINLDFEKETVADLNNLTDAEKEAAKAKIKGANADVVEVIFDKAGNATVVTKDGKVLAIAAEDIFKQRPSAPNNGGNGTSGNNGTTNTDVKVDKAKLEGAIRQLDELIIKESAKLDAETAKEANDLLADAKKVFANADASQAEVDAMVKRIEDFMAKVAPSTDHATPANDQAAQTPAVASATTQAAANASQTASAQANTRTVAKELPNTGTADSVVSMVAAAASALLGLGLAGRRRKEDEEA